MKLNQLKSDVAIVGMILCLMFAPFGKAAFAAEPNKAQPTVAKERKKVTPDFTKKKAKKPAKKATKAK